MRRELRDLLKGSKTQRELVSLRSLTSASSHTVFENHPKILFILGFTQKSAKTSDFWRESSVSKYGAECFEESV